MSKRTGWGREFDDLIELPDGGELVTLKDGGNYIMKLPKAEHEAPEWQAATEALGGPTMLTRIGIMRALNRRHVRVFQYGPQAASLGKAEAEEGTNDRLDLCRYQQGSRRRRSP
jgi:hypothetical protein